MFIRSYNQLCCSILCCVANIINYFLSNTNRTAGVYSKYNKNYARDGGGHVTTGETLLMLCHPEATPKIRMINRKNRSNVFRHPELVSGPSKTQRK
jgi:hypothetical protein